MRPYTPALILSLAAAAIATVAGQTGSSQPKPSYVLANAPAALQPAAQRAQQAFATFQTTLVQRMNDELAAIENLKLSPAEKQLARDAVRKRYLGQ